MKSAMHKIMNNPHHLRWKMYDGRCMIYAINVDNKQNAGIIAKRIERGMRAC
jgi:hypothetical protein